ncbi:MAG: hypothetical protein RIC55_25790 [Pirellulaceae bacterium]
MPETIDAYTKNDYLEALRKCEPIADHEMRLFRAHYSADDQTATATELAQAVGYKNYSGVNLQYGRFAGRLCEAFNRDLPTKLEILLTFKKPDRAKNGHWRFVMRQQVVEAARDLGWL